MEHSKWIDYTITGREQIKEADQNYDLRVYETFLIISISKNSSGDMQEVQTEIRGIPYVTTVRTVGVSKDIGQRYVAKISVKFALLGGKSRVKFRDEILIPKVTIIKGVQIHKIYPIHRINRKGTIRRIRESEKLNEYMINDYSQHAIPRRTSKKMVTPRQTIQQMVDDYASSKQQPYDVPIRTNNIAYHVMLPVEELEPYISSYYRGDRMKYESSYEDFIAHGPKVPIFLAIGANGRAKITGNEDIVFFALEAGQKELPVFISYQRQV